MKTLCAFALLAFALTAHADSITCMNYGGGLAACSNGTSAVDLGGGITSIHGRDGSSATVVDLGGGMTSIQTQRPYSDSGRGRSPLSLAPLSVLGDDAGSDQ